MNPSMMNRERLHLLACGFLRKYFNEKNTNPKDIAQIIIKFLPVDWKFEYFYDYDNRTETKQKRKKYHGIYDDGKTIKCSEHLNCPCFYRVSFAMIPNSGIYSIKIKIDHVGKDDSRNAIGITCNTHETNNSLKEENWYLSDDYIAWTAWNNPYNNKDKLKHGLLCGYDKYLQVTNIFIQSKFVYKSNNEYYTTALPYIRTGDTVILQYDSNKNSLSFFKTNDKKLNAQITNLPKDKTFYWFIGHCFRVMSMTIIDEWHV